MFLCGGKVSGALQVGTDIFVETHKGFDALSCGGCLHILQLGDGGCTGLFEENGTTFVEMVQAVGKQGRIVGRPGTQNGEALFVAFGCLGYISYLVINTNTLGF